MSRGISILQGLRPFDRAGVPTQVIAGVTLAALAIPEVMGYTSIAGMPVITGLYTIVLPVIVFAAARLVAPPGRRRRLRHGRGDGGRAGGAGGDRVVAVRRARRPPGHHGRRLPHPRPPPQTRFPGELPVPHRADRLPHRGRHPGRRRPGGRHARHPRGHGDHHRRPRVQRHHRQAHLHPREPRRHQLDDGRGDRGRAGHDPRVQALPPQDPRGVDRGDRCHRHQLVLGSGGRRRGHPRPPPERPSHSWASPT